MKHKRINVYKTIISMALIMTMVFSTPISHLQGVLAEESVVVDGIIESELSLDVATTGTEEPFTEDVVVGVGLLEEDEEKREQNVKHFFRNDGLVEAVYYPYPVHYDMDGEWADIDNSLVEKNVNGKIVYENTANSFKVSFSKETDSESLVSLDSDGSSLSWVIPEMGTATPIIEEVTDSTNDIRFQNKLFTKITYEDAINGVDVTYMLTPGGIKEYFIIENEEELEAFNDITIVMKTNDLEISKVDSKLQMKKDADKKFTLSEPVMYDSSNEFVSTVPFEVEEITGIDKRAELTISEDVGTTDSDTDDEISSFSQTAMPTETAETVNTNEVTEEIQAEGYTITETADITVEEGEELNLEVEATETPQLTETEGEEVEEIIEDVESTEPEFIPEIEEVSVIESEPLDKTSAYINELEATITVDDSVNYYTYTIGIDKEIIAEADITYPLIIDPDITAEDSVANMHDTFVSENYPTTNYGSIERLKIGYGSKSGINRAYMKLVKLPELKNGDMIVGAKLYMIRYYDENTEGFDYDNQINLHKVTASWVQSDMTWEDKADYDSTVISCDFSDYIDADSESDAFINEFDITKLVKEWYEDPTTNYGVMLKNADETSGYHEYRSADQWNENVLHQVVDIVYVNSTGIESNYSYHELAVGRAGTVYINDATGNATLIHSDTSSTDGKMPFDLYHVFDNNYHDTNLGYGYGWRLNYDQSVKAVTIGDNSYYKYTDGDGTVHYYYKDGNVYYDEGNKKNKLTVSGNIVTIEDTAAHITYKFDSAGRLQYIIDANGNTLQIERNSWGCVEQITDAEGQMLLIDYSDGLLDKIYCIDGYEIDYNYDGKRLIEIVYQDSNTSTFSYDSDGYLTDINDIDNYKVKLEYNASSKKQVSKATDYVVNGTNETAYNYLTFNYKTLLTTVTDNRGRTNHYRFNKYGQLINEQDYDGSAVYYDYETRTPGKKDNLSAASDILSTAINLIGNSSFEYNEGYITSAWQIENTNGTVNNQSVIQLSPESYIGDNSLELFKNGAGGTSKTYTTVTVEPGKTYTVSLYYNGIMDAYLFAEYTSASGTTVTEEKELVKISGEWTKNSLVVKIPSGSGTSLKVGIMEKGDTAIGFGAIDAVQVSENGTARRYNLIKNPDFRNGLNCWVSKFFTTGDGYVSQTSGNEYKPDNLDDNVVKISGNIDAGKYIYQNVGESGVANDSYIVGAFVKSEGIPKFTHTLLNASTATTYGSMLIRVQFLNGNTVVNQVDKAFSYDTSDWQYLSFNAKAEGDFTSIRVGLHFARNQNNAYFDGVSLYKDGYGTAYTYDANNNLEKIVTEDDKSYLYEYDSNNNLTKSTDEYGDVTEYEYDAKHNLTKVTTTPSGTSIKKYTEYTYDANGNITETVTYDSRNTGKCFISNSEYSGNYKSKDTDSRENSVEYTYDDVGRLYSVKDNKDTIYYGYNSLNRVSNVRSGSANQQVFYSYSGDNLSSILLSLKTGGIRLRYNFSYNAFGQLTNTYVNNQLLSTNTYDNLKRLDSTTYANGHVMEYGYNIKDQLTEIYEKEDGNMYVTATYGYSDEGYLTEVSDYHISKDHFYDYDDEGRLIRHLASPEGTNNGTKASVSYSYDDKDRAVKAVNKVGTYTWIENYTYDDTEYTNYALSTSDGIKANTKYDCLGRIDERVLGEDRAVVMDYDYENGTLDNSTTSLVNYFYSTGQTIKRYTYDETGLIKSITASNGDVYYSYDNNSQLTGVLDDYNDTVTTYTYDDGGNITRKTRTYNYSDSENSYIDDKTYTYDSTWADLLVSYGGKTITYDAIGNPTKYLDYESLTWTGRNLDSIQDNGTFIAYYGYDINGLRYTKKVGTTITEYIYTDGQLSALKVGDDMLYFSYDVNGTLVSVKYNDEIYYYVINPQGDVVGLCDETGANVAKYTYDEWGLPLSQPTSGIGALNPFRYRGYIYDAETGFYYLESRYYDPEVGRFISADSYASTGQGINGHNMFAYCNNNPVNFSDPTGEFLVTAWEYLKEAYDEIEYAMSTMSAAYAGCGTVAVADGPLPFGDAIGFSGLVIITVGAIGYGLYEAADNVNRVEKKSTTREKSKVNANVSTVTNTHSSKFNYWTAEIQNKMVVPIIPLSYSEAQAWVASGNNLLCRNHAAAFAIVKFWPSAVWEPRHKALDGYLNHYHLSTAHGNHIWYYGE